MGINSSKYNFKNTESIETILRILNEVRNETFQPDFRITVASTSQDKVLRIMRDVSLDLVKLSLSFKTEEDSKFGEEIRMNNEFINGLNVSFQYKSTSDMNTIRMTYNGESKSSWGIIFFSNESIENTSNHLKKFLTTINEYSKFGPENEDDIVSLARTIITLNSRLKNQSKWIYQTDYLTFEPYNGYKTKDNDRIYNSIRGLQVQFAEVYSKARNAHRMIEILAELKKYFESDLVKVNFTTNDLKQAAVLERIQAHDVSANFLFKVDDIKTIKPLEWLLQENVCSIQLSSEKFSSEGSSGFGLYLSGYSLNKLDLDLFIDIKMSEENKKRILSLFEGRLKYIGDR